MLPDLSQEAEQILPLEEQESERHRHFYLSIERIFIALSKADKQ